MALLKKAIEELFSGRPSSITPPSSRKGNKPKNDDGNSRHAPTSGFSTAAARRPGKRGDGVHGIMTSALWAVARTPALVEAIGRVEATYNAEVSDLCLILSKLRRRTDDEAAEAADTFLRATPLTFYDHMEPIDAIRAIVGLSADSDQVLEEAASTTYRYNAPARNKQHADSQLAPRAPFADGRRHVCPWLYTA